MEAVITVGLPASGKTTYASLNRDLLDINLDECRKLVCGDPANQEATQEALKLRDKFISDAIVGKRSVIISDTNLVPEHRQVLIELFKSNGYEVTLVVFNIPYDVCLNRNNCRDRVVPNYAMSRMLQLFETWPPEACAQKHGLFIRYIDLVDQQHIFPYC